MLDGVMGEVFKFIGVNVVAFAVIIPTMKACLSSNRKIHKNKQFKKENKNRKQWFYDVA